MTNRIQQLQTKILADERYLRQRADMASKLPSCDARVKFVQDYKRHENQHSIDQYDLLHIDPNACLFGFTDKCTGLPCWQECPYGERI
jgi:hypothetical protein